MIEVRWAPTERGVRYTILDTDVVGHARNEGDAYYKAVVFIRLIYAGGIVEAVA